MWSESQKKQNSSVIRGMRREVDEAIRIFQIEINAMKKYISLEEKLINMDKVLIKTWEDTSRRLSNAMKDATQAKKVADSLKLT